jgi:predicted nuclease of predicted toxin-antitoxin system
MMIWIDAQLSPSLALWINQSYKDINACSVRSLDLRDADDEMIFNRAKNEKAVIMSKDADFVKLLERFGPPPQIIWVTSGNTSNAVMREILGKHLPTIIEMLGNGEQLIEIGAI